jgi:hypothetical protein
MDRCTPENTSAKYPRRKLFMSLKSVCEKEFLAVFFIGIETCFCLFHCLFPGIAKHKALMLPKAFQNPVNVAHFGLRALDTELAVTPAYR